MGRKFPTFNYLHQSIALRTGTAISEKTRMSVSLLLFPACLLCRGDAWRPSNLTPLFSSEDIMEKQFCHMELQTGDVDKARDFYKGLFVHRE